MLEESVLKNQLTASFFTLVVDFQKLDTVVEQISAVLSKVWLY